MHLPSISADQLARCTGGGAWDTIRDGAQSVANTVWSGYEAKSGANRGLLAGITGGPRASDSYMSRFGDRNEPGFKMGAEVGMAARTYSMMK